MFMKILIRVVALPVRTYDLKVMMDQIRNKPLSTKDKLFVKYIRPMLTISNVVTDLNNAKEI